MTLAVRWTGYKGRERSWHLMERATDREALCGRVIGGNHEIRERMPATTEGRSCETCLRVYARSQRLQ